MIREARRLAGVLKRAKKKSRTEDSITRISEQLSEMLEMMTPQERECINGIDWFADGNIWIINEAFLYAVGEDIEVIDEVPYQNSYDASYDQTEDAGRETTPKEASKLKSMLAKLKAK